MGPGRGCLRSIQAGRRLFLALAVLVHASAREEVEVAPSGKNESPAPLLVLPSQDHSCVTAAGHSASLIQGSSTRQKTAFNMRDAVALTAQASIESAPPDDPLAETSSEVGLQGKHAAPVLATGAAMPGLKTAVHPPSDAGNSVTSSTAKRPPDRTSPSSTLQAVRALVRKFQAAQELLYSGPGGNEAPALLVLLVVPLAALVLVVAAVEGPQEPRGCGSRSARPSRPATALTTLSTGSQRHCPRPNDVRNSCDSYLAMAGVGSSLPSMASATPRTASELSAGQLCPILMVPEGCLCTLLVPLLQLRSDSRSREIAIKDPKKYSVMWVTFNAVADFDSRQTAGPRLPGMCHDRRSLLLSGPDVGYLAYCQEANPNDSDSAPLTIHGMARPFGALRPAGPDKQGYEVMSHAGWLLRLSPLLFPAGNGWVAATDERGRLLAVAEPVSDDAQIRKVRIDSFVDAGLITLSLLGIDLVEAAA
eukprot:CAMPEP_0168365568 /NCGR_PEP_ID=MMETSP0228-20121227/4784_1 /TAXON_ID=133427 /ORGANISM="Protoceratium reticulatum, Strain CCCM 535 (=CCMP 1889)" /LENGTH=477 /DNA_ID=CAMNT_0008378351 /DNA_START=94 /DNA_END=1528 /DNA_ORIENTATION=+